MSTEHTQADVLILGAELQSHPHKPNETPEQSRLGNCWEIGVLRAIVRNLCDKLAEARGAVDCQTEHAKTLRGIIAEQANAIARQRNQIREQQLKLNELTFRLCDDDGEDLGPARFMAGDAADAAQWGPL